MIYKQTVNEIKAAANLVNPHGHFDHGRVVDFSQDFKKDGPIIWLYPWKIKDPVVSDFIYEHPIVIGFYEHDTPHSSNEERLNIIDRMEALMEEFMDQLLTDNSKFSAYGIESEPQYQMHNQTVSGFAVRFTYQNFDPCL
jgi:hypothetical protein